MIERRCDECRWWHWFDAVPTGPDQDSIGECRRFPPPLPATTDDGSDWPETYATDWCGEWQAKEEPDAKDA